MSTISATRAILPSQATTASIDWGKWLGIAAPLVVILVACVSFRLLMAKGEARILHALEPELLAQPWQLLLPVDLGGGRYRWTTTGFVPLSLLNLWLPAPYILVLLLAILVITAYLLSYVAMRSRVFSGTLALCMCFGSQFNYAYVHSGGHHWVLFTTYLLTNLFFLHALATRPVELRWPRIGFVASLIVFALSWEQWLDYLVFLQLACALGYLLARRDPHLRQRYVGRLRFVALTGIVIAAIYLAVRIPYSGEHVNAGHESDTIFTYSAWLIGIDDMISNVFTYLYIAITNFCPSWFNASNSLYHVGAERILAEQNGYHPEKTHLVEMHHLFFWHFYAGMVFVGFAALFYRTVRRALTAPDHATILVLALLLLVGTGFATHTIIKFRPYLSVPLLAYKCIVSVMGVALLLSLAVTRAADWFAGPRKRLLFVGAVWVALVLVGIERFSYHAQMCQQAGLGVIPDPIRAAKDAVRQVVARTPKP